MLKSMNDENREKFMMELQDSQAEYEKKVTVVQDAETHILELNNKIADLKLDLQNALMQGEKNVVLFERKGKHFLEKVSCKNIVGALNVTCHPHL